MIKRFIAPQSKKSVQKDTQRDDEQLEVLNVPIGCAPPKPPRRLRKFVANVRGPGAAAEARNAAQKAIHRSPNNNERVESHSAYLDEPAPQKQQDRVRKFVTGVRSPGTAAEARAAIQKDIQKAEEKFETLSLNSTQSSSKIKTPGRMRKFVAGIRGPGAAAEARAAMQKENATSEPTFGYDSLLQRSHATGTYFKVVFIGEEHFGKDLHRTEWLYRDRGIISLAEFSMSLLKRCQEQLGHNNIKIEPEKERPLLNVSDTSHDRKFAYVQVTHVEPFFYESEEADLQTHTAKQYFVYENPIYEDWDVTSNCEPPLQNHALKRTFVTVLGHFSNTTYRLPINKEYDRHEILNPLEFAVRQLKMKEAQILRILDCASSTGTVDLKGLQLLLQGVLMTTVNAGPLAYAAAFSRSDQRKRYGRRGIETLCEAFRDLLRACDKGLKANARAIGADQRKYHEMLANNACTMKERLADYFGGMFYAAFERDLGIRSGTSSLDSGRYSM